MPIFGLPFTLDDDERRRRIAEQALSTGAFPRGALTPPISPDALSPVRLPELPTRPAPRPLPSPGVPGGMLSGVMPGVAAESPPPRPLAMPDMSTAPLPEFRPPMPTRAEELGGAKEEFMAKTPGRFKSGVLNALRGFAGGLSTGGGLGAGLGGAVAGGAFGAINPRGAREMEFEQVRKPRIFERFAMEDQERAARQTAEKALREEMRAQTDIANIHSQIQSRAAADALNQSKFDLEQYEPLVLNPSQVALDRRTRQPVFTAPPDPRQGAMTAPEAEAALTSEEGTVEEVSWGSLRGRLESLKKHLTPDERRLIEGGATPEDDPQAVARAHAKWQKIQDSELQSIRRDTGERRKAKVSQRRFGNKQRAAQPSGYIRNVNDLPPLR